jgi:hypothetical protein
MRDLWAGSLAAVVACVLQFSFRGAAVAQTAPQPPPVVGSNGLSGFVIIGATAPGSTGGTAGVGLTGATGSGSSGAGTGNPLANLGGQVMCAVLPGLLGPTNVPQCAATAAAPAAAGAVPAPPPDPAVVALVAIDRLDLVAGTPQTSANPRTAVGLPVWLWITPTAQNAGPRTATATAGPTTVTATAHLTGTRWSMGPAGATVSCATLGTPAPARPLYAGDSSPTCGYTYQLRSLAKRTGGTGSWPVTATSVWAITWAGGGQTGGQTLELAATTPVEVGELQALVTGGS